jgi:NADH-quinone oxidoreductase subunit G
LIGDMMDLGYPFDHLGSDARVLEDLVAGKGSFAEILKNATYPMVIVGSGAAARADGKSILALAAKLALAIREGKDDGWQPFNLLSIAASRVAGLDLGFVPLSGGLDALAQIKAAQEGRLEVLYLLGADEFDMSAMGSAFVVYQGTHGDAGAQRADVILPGSAYTEKSATYVNTEGRAQMTVRATFAPGEAKEDWAIIRALSAEVGHTLPYDTLQALRVSMYKSAPLLAELDRVRESGAAGLAEIAKEKISIGAGSLSSPIKDFYLTNPIARASAVMAEMSALKKAASQAQRLSAAE